MTGSRSFSLAFLVALTLSSSAEGAIISLNGMSPNTPIAGMGSNGAPIVGAYVDPYHSGDPSVPSSFSNNFLVINNETKSSSPIAFSTVPYVTSLAGELFFAFVLDSQETQAGASLQFSNIRLLVNGIAIWTSTDALLINDGLANNDPNTTRTPLGNGADLALMIPVYAFNYLGLTGASTFVFEATETLGHNGNDEWKLIAPGYAGTAFFTPNTPVYSPQAVPEPSTLALTMTAVLALLRGRRSRQRQRNIDG